MRYGNNIRKVPRIKTPQLNKNGYQYVVLEDGGKTKAWAIHRLVLTAFTETKPSSVDACHLDGDRLNNALANLCWATRKENEAHKLIHETKAVGKRNGQSKLTETQVIEIKRLRGLGKTCKEIANQFEVSQQTISYVSTKGWSHVSIN